MMDSVTVSLPGLVIIVVAVIGIAAFIGWILRNLERERLLDAFTFIEFNYRVRSFPSAAALNAVRDQLISGQRSIGETDLGGNTACVVVARGRAEVDSARALQSITGKRMRIYRAYSYDGAPTCDQHDGRADLVMLLDGATRIAIGSRTILTARIVLPSNDVPLPFTLGVDLSIANPTFGRIEVTAVDRATRFVYGSFEMMLHNEVTEGADPNTALFVASGRFGVRVPENLL